MFAPDRISVQVIDIDSVEETLPVDSAAQYLDWKMLKLKQMPFLERHWHPESEIYGSLDALITALDRGWLLHREIYAEECSQNRRRTIMIFYLTLVRGNERMQMPIISNPALLRFMDEHHFYIFR